VSTFPKDNKSPIIRQFPGAITGVGAGQTAVVKIPTGATFLELGIECTIAGVGATRAQFGAMVTLVRGLVSGVEKWSLTAAELISVCEFYRTGSVGDTGFLIIPFERLFMSELGGKLNPAYGTVDESSFQIEITQAGGSTIDAMTLWGRIATVGERLGSHVRWAKLMPNIASTGIYNYMDLSRNPREALLALHLVVPVVANLVNIAVIADSIRVIDASPAWLNRLYAMTDPVRTPQTANLMVHVDFANRNLLGDALPLTMDQIILELNFANAAPNQISVIQELFTPEPTQAGA
jgi:Viral coat protein P2 N-terminal domain